MKAPFFGEVAHIFQKAEKKSPSILHP